jgi:hypothetical protein
MKNTSATLSQNPAAIAKRAKRAALKTPVAVVVKPAAKATPAPAQAKSAPVSTPKKSKVPALPEMIARPGSCVDNIYQVLRDQKPHPRTAIFASIANSQSQYQIITDLRKLGVKQGLFEIALVNAETREYQLKPLAK